MSTLTTSALPQIDGRTQTEVTDAQATFFRKSGLLLIRNLLSPRELKAMQDATLPHYLRAINEQPADPDFCYAQHELTGVRTPFRIEYIIDKDTTGAARRLLGNPFILRSIERLQGRNLIPTWDSMVFKREGMGKAIPWHRDGAPYTSPKVDLDVAAINVDFYLDGSDMSNCLWGILGSNRWTPEEAKATIERLNNAPGSFSTDEQCVPIPVNPGDVLFHNVLVLHGSAAARTQLRRVVYYEFRPGEVEHAHGPHTREYLPLKQRVLQACLGERNSHPDFAHEIPYAYRPTGEFALSPLRPDETVPSFRYPHQAYWRGARQ